METDNAKRDIYVRREIVDSVMGQQSLVQETSFFERTAINAFEVLFVNNDIILES